MYRRCACSGVSSTSYHSWSSSSNTTGDHTPVPQTPGLEPFKTCRSAQRMCAHNNCNSQTADRHIQRSHDWIRVKPMHTNSTFNCFSKWSCTQNHVYNNQQVRCTPVLWMKGSTAKSFNM